MSWVLCAGVRPIPGYAGYFVSDCGEVFSQRPLRNGAETPAVPRRLKATWSGTRKPDGSLCSYGVRLRRDGESVTFNVGHVVYMTFVGPVPEGLTVDHIDRDPSNNVVPNLRLATPSQQMMNRGKLAGTSSQYLGVNWNKEKSKWVAHIQVDGRRCHLGYFTDEAEAARAYDAAARVHFGSFANCNFEPTGQLVLWTG